MGLSLQNIDKIVGRDTHLNDINLEFESGSRNVLLGRTLAGKTSLLRIMAGIDRPTRGKILINGKDTTGVWVRKRSVAMVYQQFINYPHLSVLANVVFPLKRAGVPRDEARRQAREVLAKVGLTDFENRRPAALSGGQQQRLCIARTIAPGRSLTTPCQPACPRPMA